MRALSTLLLIVVVAVLAILAWNMVDVRRVGDGEMPTVQVDGGKLPKFDVDVGRLKVGERVENVDVPTLKMPEVGSESREVRVPVLSVERPAPSDQ